MIQILSRYQQRIAYLQLLIFILSFAPASYASHIVVNEKIYSGDDVIAKGSVSIPSVDKAQGPLNKFILPPIDDSFKQTDKNDIGGPSQPETSSFKSVGNDNMVNLFTGDFSYNVPLMDVGGYPINLFYEAGISSEQEASWVGLGWNINPGTVNRNMRGVPDDFNGEDRLAQVQMMKVNKTWGWSVGADFELFGYKQLSLGLGSKIGMSYNNYLGPAMNVAVKGLVTANIAVHAGSEKTAGDGSAGASATAAAAAGNNTGVGTTSGGGGSISAGFNMDLSSRTGLTFSPSVSMAKRFQKIDKQFSSGLTISTDYNSRSGIRTIQLSEQNTLSRHITGEKGAVERHSLSNSLHATSISFARPSYVPALRMPITNTAGTAHIQVGAGGGAFTSAEVEYYFQKSRVVGSDSLQSKPLVGYLYYQNAKTDPNAIMDFSRMNDKEVMPNTSIVSAPQYSYDVFSITGEGTGGTVRAYRTDLGYIRDNYTSSKDQSTSAGADLGIPGHFGANFSIVKTPSVIGEWKINNRLKQNIGFEPSSMLDEKVYIKNPGETTVLNEGQYDNIGGADLVRFKLGGNNSNPSLEQSLEVFNSQNKLILTKPLSTEINGQRNKRSQVVNFLTAEEAEEVGLDSKLKSYHAMTIPDNNFELFTSIGRYEGDYRKKHHISEIDVTEASGRRYIYGIPVYNAFQKDFSFSVSHIESAVDQVEINTQEMSVNSTLLNDVSARDGYLNVTTTPGYANSYLLTGLLSSDYVDVTGNGISDDDLGDAVKFNYTKMDGLHAWRTPLSGNVANFNAGNLTEVKDDKGVVSYGERESWYLQSIESKTFIAIFTLMSRDDGKGSSGIAGGINSNDHTVMSLDKIDLYSKTDYFKNGTSGARPIKTVKFSYGQQLCNATPDNQNAGGKLTLNSIEFSFNNQVKAKKNKYVFSYGDLNSATDNPAYEFSSTDRWGTYKPRSINPETGQATHIKNSEFPYTIQDPTKLSTLNTQASAWSLKKILLPSGGQLEVEYESDDYAFVQNKRAATMMPVLGFGQDSLQSSVNLYDLGAKIIENFYVFIQIPEPCLHSQVYSRYLEGLKQFCFKYAVKMPRGYELVTSYAEIEGYGKRGPSEIWLKLKPVDKVSPLSLTAIDYLREQLPGQAWEGYDMSEENTENNNMLFKTMLSGLGGAFKSPVKFLRESKRYAREVNLSRSFVRLNDPDGRKYGGGHRVKTIKLKDNWNVSTTQFGSTYTQQYSYETNETFEGTTRTISSGVASYEPGIGGEENPFHSIVQIADRVPLGPVTYGAIELPVLEGFFPSSGIGYSKVTVRSIPDGTLLTSKKSRSLTGKQVTEFYTAKDFPVYVNHTLLDPSADRQQHDANTTLFHFKNALDKRTISQGFIVATNDMHGKVKAQYTYAETDPNTPIAYTKNFYRNTGLKGLDEKFDFVFQDGSIKKGNMGIDIELMNDAREFSTRSSSFELQAQVDIVVAPIPTIWPVIGETENTYRAITSTKVVNYHSILESVEVMDKGSVISTHNLLYDAETGEVVVSKTNNEFNLPLYNTAYPAYWAYPGMGPAYKNIDAIFKPVNFRDGRITGGIPPEMILKTFESGDEIYLISAGTPLTEECMQNAEPASGKRLWVINKNKSSTGMYSANPDFIFIDSRGRPFSANAVSIRIIRSGHRNQLGEMAGSASSMISPITESGTVKLALNGGSKVISASAAEYRELWQADNDVIKKLKTVLPPDIPQGQNLIGNSNFELGNSSFVSDYTYYPSTYQGGNEGKYTIATNPHSWNSDLTTCGDHTTGSGKMLIVNSATTSGKIAWRQYVIVAKQVRYKLQFWFARVHPTNTPSLKVTVNNVQIGGSVIVSANNCAWSVFTTDWDSGENTSANIEISNINTIDVGNDFALDDITFYSIAHASCGVIEVEDCEGYLEKKINPYRKGLLGNFHPYQTKVFYGSRTEPDLTNQTNISQNGFLADFKLYWDFANDHLIPDESNTKWVWNTRINRINSRGLELETKDALGIYTAAQYGFNKSLPVAIANNARYDEMANEGFEDRDYHSNGLTILDPDCFERHIDFKGLPHGTIVETTDYANPIAHTGRFALEVEAGQTLVKKIPIKAAVSEQYSVLFDEAFGKQLSDPGFNIDLYTANTATTNSANPSLSGALYSNSTYGNGVVLHNFYPQDDVTNGNPNYSRTHSFQVKSSAYISITSDGWYKPTLSVIGDGDGSAYSNYMSLIIKNRQDIQIASYSKTVQCCGTEYYSIYLCKGVYKIEGQIASGFNLYSNNPISPMTHFATFSYGVSVTGTCYKSLAEQQTCIYTKPIAASSDMLNPVFGIPANKKMLLSLWVKEKCGNTTTGAPCNLSTFAYNKVRLEYNGGNSQVDEFTPAGAIIEGWQRYEAVFTAPSTATEMTFKLMNLSSDPVYFDDIRFHPYSANMKTYIYDPINLRLRAEMDDNNYARFYEYDEQGSLIRVKAETNAGIKTINETRSSKQNKIITIQ